MLLEQFRDSQAAKLQSYELLQRIFEEQCEVVDGSAGDVAIRPPRTTDCDTVISPADPDARYKKHKGTGYLVQLMETFVEDDAASRIAGDDEQDETKPAKPDLITYVAVERFTAWR